MKKKLSPYQRIIRNAAKYKGVRLSAEEVQQMATDDAIIGVAENEDAGENVRE